MTIVATTTARRGGTCDNCGTKIAKGEQIWKIATPGRTTSYGNGPGKWCCASCATADARTE